MTSRRVLIVNDDQDLAESMAEFHGNCGFSVEIALGGEAGVEMTQQKPFDFVLSAVRMPGLNGFEAYMEMKKIRPGLSIHLMTALAMGPILRQSRKSGWSPPSDNRWCQII